MQNEFLKTLWLLRFQKIKDSEERAAWKYQEILDRCLVDFGEPSEVVALLRRLVREERAHSRLADELIKLGYQNHPECAPPAF